MHDDLLTRLLGIENEQIEWKRSYQNTDTILKAVCALANDLGETGEQGYLVIGLDPKTGRPVKQIEDTDAAQLELVNRIEATRLVPTPSYSVDVAHLDDGSVIIVAIEPYPVPPVLTVSGIPYIRRGTLTIKATEADLLRLRERRPEHHRPFDTRLVTGASIDDLRLSPLRDAWEAARDDDTDGATFPGLDAWLTQRELNAPVDGVWRPNAAALLVHGDTPQDYYPGAIRG